MGGRAPALGALHHPGDSPVHRLAPHVKLVTLVGFVLLVVLTPSRTYWPYAAHALLLAGVLALSRVPLRHVAARMLVEVPFVVFAVVLPFVATGPTTGLGPFTVSESGLHAALALLAKGTLGVVASLLLAATTEPRALVTGFQTLRVPPPLVQVMTFMLRYADLVAADLDRMRIARASRGFTPSSVRQWPALASTLGTLFIRSYERGERVHLAMLSRGYTGQVPVLSPRPAGRTQWTASAVLLGLAATTSLVAVLTSGGAA